MFKARLFTHIPQLFLIIHYINIIVFGIRVATAGKWEHCNRGCEYII